MADENSKAGGAGRNIYADRDYEAQGANYLRHIDRMTIEGLHSKSAIAGELAHRDAEIAALREDLARMLVLVFVWMNERGDAMPDDAQDVAAGIEKHLFQYLPDDLDISALVFEQLRKAIGAAK